MPLKRNMPPIHHSIDKIMGLQLLLVAFPLVIILRVMETRATRLSTVIQKPASIKMKKSIVKIMTNWLNSEKNIIKNHDSKVVIVTNFERLSVSVAGIAGMKPGIEPEYSQLIKECMLLP